MRKKLMLVVGFDHCLSQEKHCNVVLLTMAYFPLYQEMQKIWTNIATSTSRDPLLWLANVEPCYGGLYDDDQNYSS